MVLSQKERTEYQLLASTPLGAEDAAPEESYHDTTRSSIPQSRTRQTRRNILLFCFFVLAAILGFAAGALYVHYTVKTNDTCNSTLDNVALRVYLNSIEREFDYGTEFSKEPPHGEGAGEMSEPIWDSLIPSESPITFYRTTHTRLSQIPSPFFYLSTE